MPIAFSKPPKKPSFSPHWKPPKTVISEWPPRGARGHYDVTPADNWQSVAYKAHLWDPWDVIIFNFRTGHPEEVNWYMHHALWCTESKDGKNFSFIGAGQPRVYLPPFDWIPDRDYGRGSFNHRNLTKSVIRDLGFIIPRLRAIQHRGFVVTPHRYSELRRKIETGQLKVRFAKEDEIGAVAEYDPTTDTLSLTRYDPGSFASKNDVIHELTHAIFDNEEYTALLLDEEILARIQEAVYAFAMASRPFERRIETYKALYRGNDTATAKFFVGAVIHEHFPRDRYGVINTRDLDGEYFHPLKDRYANPLNEITLSVTGDPGYNSEDVNWANSDTGDGIPSKA